MANDLALLVGGSEPPAERSGQLFELLEFCHGALVAQGVCDVSLTDERHDLQLAALGWLITVLAAVLNGDAIQR